MLTINVKTVKYNGHEFAAGTAAYIRENIDGMVAFSVVARKHNGELFTVQNMGEAYREGDYADLCDRLTLENKARRLANMLNKE